MGYFFVILLVSMSKKEQMHTSVLFELDSGSIAVSVCEFQQGSSFPKKERMSKRIALTQTDSFDRFFAQSLKTLEALAHEAQRHASQIDSIYVSLSAPWVSSQKRVIRHVNEKGFEVTESLLSKLIKKELEYPLSKNLDYHKHHNQLEIFERRTIDVYINGYPTLHPIQKRKVRDIAIHSLVSVITTTTKDAVVHTIERVFHRQPDLVSNTFILYQVIRTFLPEENNVMILDIGGMHTEMYTIYQDHLTDIASFPVGEHHILEELTKKASVSEDKARSLMTLFIQEKLHEEYHQEISLLMKKTYQLWLSAWYEVCNTLSAKQLLPSTICIIAPSYIVPWMRYHILQTDELMEHLHTHSKIRMIELPYFIKLKAEEDHVLHTRDAELLPMTHVISTLISYE